MDVAERQVVSSEDVHPLPAAGHGARRSIIAAFLGNVAIALTKGVAAVVTGSGAMLAETAHSLADSLNQVFLFIGVERSRRPATPDHPFGFGKERYFWSLVVALMLFFGGGVFSLYEAYERWMHPHDIGNALIGLLVLGVAAVFESLSLSVALREARTEAGIEGGSVFALLRRLHDPALRTVLFEDSGALAGLAIAAAGMSLTTWTGDRRFDAAGTALIGVLLVVIALQLARDARDLIIGAAPDAATRRALFDALASHPEVEQVLSVAAIRMGAGRLLLGARVSVQDDYSAADVERFLVSLRSELEREFPEVLDAFIEVNPAVPAARIRTEREASTL